MEDIKDNLPTEGKRYYLSHSEYVFTKSYLEEQGKEFEELFAKEPLKMTQLVCASDMEKAREAVVNQLEKDKKFLVLKCRIDYLIVGD